MHFCGSKQPRTFYAAAERPPKTYQLSIPVAMITGTEYGYGVRLQMTTMRTTTTFTKSPSSQLKCAVLQLHMVVVVGGEVGEDGRWILIFRGLAQMNSFCMVLCSSFGLGNKVLVGNWMAFGVSLCWCLVYSRNYITMLKGVED